MIKKSKAAFTLVELMLAMAIFSFVLLFAVNAFIQVNKIYVKGITTKRMNDQANAIIEDLSKNLQQETNPSMCKVALEGSSCNQVVSITTGQADLDSHTKYILCLPNASSGVFYAWTVATKGAFQKYSDNQCKQSATDKGGQNLIDGNTQIRALNITPVNIGSNSAWKLDLVLSTQRSEQLTTSGDDPFTTRCSGQISDQYCSVVHLTTLIRVGN